MNIFQIIEIFVFVEFFCFVNLILCREQFLSYLEFYLCSNQYSKVCNVDKKDFIDEEMFQRGYMKLFGLYRFFDYIVEEFQYMIFLQDFYMNYVVKYKLVVFKGILFFGVFCGLNFF